MGFLILILAFCAGLNFIERVNFRHKRQIELTLNLFFETLRAFWSHGIVKSCSIHQGCHYFEGNHDDQVTCTLMLSAVSLGALVVPAT